MTTFKRIVCLANSEKKGDRCIAGIEYPASRPPVWVRPVTSWGEGEVTFNVRKYHGNGTDPKVLDCFDLGLATPSPVGCQPENWQIDTGYGWVKRGAISWPDLPGLLTPDEPLWQLGPSTVYGENNKIEEQVAQTLTSSLRLLHVDDLAVSVFVEGAEYNNPRRSVMGVFSYLGSRYALAVTDPELKARYLHGNDGEFPVGEAYLTISVTRPYRGYCYKLVAAVILPP